MSDELILTNEALDEEAGIRDMNRHSLAGFSWLVCGTGVAEKYCSVLRWLGGLGVKVYGASPGPVWNGYKTQFTEMAARRAGKKFLVQVDGDNRVTHFKLVDDVSSDAST